MNWRIETTTKDEYLDVNAQEIAADIKQLGIGSVKAVRSVRVMLIEGELDREQVERVAAELLVDPVSENYYIGPAPVPSDFGQVNLFEVHLKPGVTDPVAGSALMGIRDMNFGAESARTGRKYFIDGALSEYEQKVIAGRVLGNDCIEDVLIGSDSEPPSPHVRPYELKIRNWPIRELDEAALEKMSKDCDLFLTVTEMKTIQEYFRKLEREPTDIELEMIAQTWSEHCGHKTFRGTIEFTEYDGEEQVQKVVVDNLLKSTIAKATFDLAKPWCISVFEDNAGVIDFNDDYGVCFKVETHNHPSAIEPYGGAATGIGGCIRDPMGTGLGAKPIANTDIFCFARPDKKLDELPAGVLHPRRVMKGVVAGVRDYGNRMGIPTVNGAVLFDDRYMGNPLVFCGNIGLIPRDKCFGSAREGDLIMVVGGRTGRDGIHGATFSSGEMTHEHETLFSHAVQIGNAITEKKVLDTLMQARDKGLYVAVTDCGAGGLSSAVGEMGEKLGAVVDLEKIPLKYQGLSYTEVWISEAQERMVISVPPENLDEIRAVFAAEDVEATVIGHFGNGGKLDLHYGGQIVGRLDMDFLHDGLPRFTRKAVWHIPQHAEPELPVKNDYTDDLKAILGDYNVASKEWVVRQYDHEVQGGSVIKPLVGVENDGPGDASVVKPILGEDRALAIGCGICPQYSDLDPYAMALAAIDEAVRNVVAVGARPDKISILDNFCWGNCAKPDRLGSLVKAAQGCYDAAMAYGTPFISGKDSLNNEFVTDSGETISIPGTLLVSAMAIVDDARKCVTMDLKEPGNLLVAVGPTRNELGGSYYYKLQGQLGANVPRVDLKAGPQIIKAVAEAISKGLVISCHDCSEGGLAVALAEMAFAGGYGLEADLAAVPVEGDITRDDQLLFSETTSRFVLEVRPDDFGKIAEILKNVRFGEIGKVGSGTKVVIRGRNAKKVINADIKSLKAAWQEPLFKI